MPFSTGERGIDTTTSSNLHDHESLLLELLASGDSDAHGDDDSDMYVHTRIHSDDPLADVPVFGDVLDLELGLDLDLDDLLSDDNSVVQHDQSSPELILPFASTHSSTSEYIHSPLSHTTSNYSIAVDSGHTHAAPPTTSACDAESLVITRAVVAAITRRRRSRTSAAAAAAAATTGTSSTKKRRAIATSSLSPPATASSVLKYNSNKARDERRQELLFLRRNVTELEGKLAALQLAAATAFTTTGDMHNNQQQQQQRLTDSSTASTDVLQSPQPCLSTALAVDSSPSTTTGVWHDIAQRQADLRSTAERENIRLKLVLRAQLQVAKTLEKLVQKTAAAKDAHECLRGSRYTTDDNRPSDSSDSVHLMHPPAPLATDALLFAQLLADVALSYAEVDAVFTAVGLSQLEPTRIDARVLKQKQQRSTPSSSSSSMHRTSNSIELQVVGAKLLPFDLHATADAVWHHYVVAKERTPNRLYSHNPHTTTRVTSIAIDDSDTSTNNTVVESFTMQVDVNGTRVVFGMKLVLRRYVEAARVVIVWRAFFDPLHVANERLEGVRFLEKGYVVVTRLPATEEASQAPHTQPTSNLLQTCFLSTPVSIGDLVHAEPARIGALTDLVLRSTAANIASSHQMIENVLLEQSWQNKQ